MSEQEHEEQHKQEWNPRAIFSRWVAVGIAIGTAIGVAVENIPMGISTGLALGVAIGATQQRRKR